MPVVPRVNHDREQRPRRRDRRNPDGKHGTNDGEQRDDDRADRETRDDIGKCDGAGIPCR
jgi:hypothetical protein